MSRKIILAILITAICGGIVASTHFMIDHTAPDIRVRETPVLSCQVSFDELLNYATAEDENLKSFFIEESSLSDIADYRYLTYVAIDESNNVSKQRVTVYVDDELTTYHIEVLQPLKAQIKENFRTGSYLVLRNGCGWNIDESFIIEGVDYSAGGTYEIKIKAKKHSNVEPLYTTMDVGDFKAPEIILTAEEVIAYTGQTFDDVFFLDFIDRVEDDEDDEEELKKRVMTNWKEVTQPDEKGIIDKAGSYSITYRVTDSEGNTGKTILKLTLQKPIYITPVPEAKEGE